MKRKSCDSFSKDRTQADEEQKRNNPYLPLPLENILGFSLEMFLKIWAFAKGLQKTIQETTLDHIDHIKL